MENITYSLKGNRNNSDDYYKDISKFTDEVLSESKHLSSLINEFESYVKENNPNEIQSSEEYVFEFLMIGTYWRVYGIPSSKLNRTPRKLLEILVYLRYKYKSLKSGVDILRGILMTFFMVQNHENTTDSLDLTLNNFDKLLKYLQATGEFIAEIKKLKIWRDFIAAKTPEEVSEYLASAFLLADWFETRSEPVLGGYTKNVKKFLAEKHQEHLWKEDVIFCGRRPVEYHLIMVGAEIMNRAFKKDFDKQPRKALILPACMRSKLNEKCRAEDTNLGLRCTGCSKSCNVRQLTDMGKEYGFEVYIISHESNIFSKITKKDINGLGIIGVACISNLIAGGINSKSLGIPAQCVLLDYRGCKNHWLEEDFPTDINVNEMMHLFNLNKISVKLDAELTPNMDSAL
jgi:hypothetical protein